MERMVQCGTCGHLEFAEAPGTCPVCGSPRAHDAEQHVLIHAAAHEGKEKHVPVIVYQQACGLIPGVCQDLHIKVGDTPHPMTPEHWIQWIDTYLNRRFLSRYQLRPEHLQAAVSVHMKADAKGDVTVIEHCNVHGYWMATTTV